MTTMDDKYDCIVRRCFSSADARRRFHSPAGRPRTSWTRQRLAVGRSAPLRPSLRERATVVAAAARGYIRYRVNSSGRP